MTKTIIENMADTDDGGKTWRVKKVEAGEEDVWLDFGQSVNYQVVKLSIGDLPQQDEDGKPIKWINNWGIKHGSGSGSGGWVDHLDYTVFLPKRVGPRFVYYTEKGGVKKDKTPRDSTKPNRPNMFEVDFDTGDPGAGWA
ncbi:MAG TPA: hypothetical protein VLY63_11940 [Anaerolineae bacterium]|nr:hypothetical protein [Anaerolineae bacterium]